MHGSTRPVSGGRTLLLGREETRYGASTRRTLPGGTTALALSVGADPASPSLRFKGDPAFPNEDAAFALDEGGAVLLAVADGHHGLEASHRAIEALHAGIERVPATALALEQALAGLDVGAPRGPTRSGAALLVAAWHRRARQGFGLSWGDASFFLLDPRRPARRLNTRTRDFLRLAADGRLPLGAATRFRFTASRGALLLACTDGVDGCHYDHPRTSVAPRHLQALAEATGAKPEVYAERLVRLALSGVDGHPGGQDNVAVVVSAA